MERNFPTDWAQGYDTSLPSYTAYTSAPPHPFLSPFPLFLLLPLAFNPVSLYIASYRFNFLLSPTFSYYFLHSFSSSLSISRLFSNSIELFLFFRPLPLSRECEHMNT